MSIVTRVDNLRAPVGGEPHSGWLAGGAATPLPTPTRDVVLTFTIESTGAGYLLIIDSADGTVRGDTWYATIADAEAQAHLWYGLPPAARQAAGEA